MGKHKGPKDNKKDKDKKKKKGAGTAEDDAETAKQVKEIEERLQDISQEMNTIDVKIKRFIIEGKRAELTNKELDQLPNDSMTFRQIGRCWLKQPKKGLVENLKAMTALKQVEQQQLRLVRQKLEERARSEGTGLQELIGLDKFKEMFGKEGQKKEDPSKTFAAMNAKKDDGMMPIFGKPALEAVPEESADAAPAAAGQEPEVA